VVNILAWDRLPEGQGEALPMCGWFFNLYFEHNILSVAVNTRILCDIMVKGTNEVRDQGVVGIEVPRIILKRVLRTKDINFKTLLYKYDMSSQLL